MPLGRRHHGSKVYQPNRNWEYLFFLDVEGHPHQDELRSALAEIRGYTNLLRILGAYSNRSAERAAVSVNARSEKRPLRVPVEIPEKPKLDALQSQVPLAAIKEDLKRTVVDVSGVAIGGEEFVVIAGPCAVESNSNPVHITNVPLVKTRRLLDDVVKVDSVANLTRHITNEPLGAA